MKNGKLYVLAISDIHFGKKDDKKLYEELDKYFISKIIEEKENIDVVQINGDLYDRTIKMNEESAKIVSNFVLTLNDLSIKYNFKLRLLRGTLSHDSNQLEVFRKLEISNPNFKIFNKVDSDIIDEDNQIVFLQIPEEYVEDPDSYYEPYIKLEEGKWDMVFFHGTFDFAGYIHNIPNNSEKHMKNAPTFKVSDFKDNVYGAVVGGHIHTRMEKDNVYYTGSFSRFAFGEEKSKGFYEIFYDPETLEAELNFIENKEAPTYITIDLEGLPEDITEKTKIIQGYREEYDFIRIKSDEDISNSKDLEMLKEFSSKDSSLKVEVTKKVENETNKEFDFVIKRELPIPETIQKFIKLKKNTTIDLDAIKDIIS